MIKLQAYFTRFGSRSDGSAGLSFDTQELTPEDFAELKKELNNFGWVVFKGNKVDLSDIPKEEAEDKQKTPSKRLRATLFVLWQQEGSQGDFELFYRSRMEKLIDHVKSKLDGQ